MLGLIRRSPAIGLSALDDRIFDGLFDDLLEQFRGPNQVLSLPSVDVYSEDDKNMVVEMQAPGFDTKDIEISVNNGVLEIRGERTEKEEHKDKRRSYWIRENSSSFARRIKLPEGADSEKISAKLDNGILRVTVPVERSEAKRIEIAAPKSKTANRLTANAKTKK